MENKIDYNEFAKKKYNEKFANLKRQDGAFHGYKNYIVLSENKIAINYIYGYANKQFTDNFIVEIE